MSNDKEVLILRPAKLTPARAAIVTTVARGACTHRAVTAARRLGGPGSIYKSMQWLIENGWIEREPRKHSSLRPGPKVAGIDNRTNWPLTYVSPS